MMGYSSDSEDYEGWGRGAKSTVNHVGANFAVFAYADKAKEVRADARAERKKKASLKDGANAILAAVQLRSRAKVRSSQTLPDLIGGEGSEIPTSKSYVGNKSRVDYSQLFGVNENSRHAKLSTKAPFRAGTVAFEEKPEIRNIPLGVGISNEGKILRSFDSATSVDLSVRRQKAHPETGDPEQMREVFEANFGETFTVVGELRSPNTVKVKAILMKRAINGSADIQHCAIASMSVSLTRAGKGSGLGLTDSEWKEKLMLMYNRCDLPLVFFQGELLGGLKEIQEMDKNGDLELLIMGMGSSTKMQGSTCVHGSDCRTFKFTGYCFAKAKVEGAPEQRRRRAQSVAGVTRIDRSGTLGSRSKLAKDEYESDWFGSGDESD